MSSASGSAAADVVGPVPAAVADADLASGIPQLPPAIPSGMECALGVNMSDSDAIVPAPAPAADNSEVLMALDNGVAALAEMRMHSITHIPFPPCV